MTKEEKLAYEYGQTFTPKDGKEAPCYDDRMHSLVTESRSLSEILKNIDILDAWWAGRRAGFEECFAKVKAARTATPVNTEALNDLRDYYGYDLYIECLRAVLREEETK